MDDAKYDRIAAALAAGTDRRRIASREAVPCYTVDMIELAASLGVGAAHRAGRVSGDNLGRLGILRGTLGFWKLLEAWAIGPKFPPVGYRPLRPDDWCLVAVVWLEGRATLWATEGPSAVDSMRADMNGSITILEPFREV